MATNFYSELETNYSLFDIEENVVEDLSVDDLWGEMTPQETFYARFV